MASPRIIRWSLTLSAYNYVLVYKPGSSIGHAESLSRFPRKIETEEPPIPGETTLLINFLNESSPITVKQISRWTTKDPILSKVKMFILQGWPYRVDDTLKSFFNRKLELSVVYDCILLGTRVVIPSQGQASVLEQLHEGHIGINKMKTLGRSYVWWPNMDKDIEMTVKKCHSCQVHHYIHGNGPKDHGQGSTLTMQDLLWEKCS